MPGDRRWPLVGYWEDWAIVLVVVLGLLASSGIQCGVSVRIDSRASHPNPAAPR